METDKTKKGSAADSHSLVVGVRGRKGAPQRSHADQLPPAASCFHPPYGCVGGLPCSGSRRSPRGGGGPTSRGHRAAGCAFRGAGGGGFFPVGRATGSLHQTLPSCKLLVPLQPLRTRKDNMRQKGHKTALLHNKRASSAHLTHFSDGVASAAGHFANGAGFGLLLGSLPGGVLRQRVGLDGAQRHPLAQRHSQRVERGGGAKFAEAVRRFWRAVRLVRLVQGGVGPPHSHNSFTDAVHQWRGHPDWTCLRGNPRTDRAHAFICLTSCTSIQES